ncbi:MAG: ferredoxin family protein [Planctomycetota bacterium]|jgi:ferredoxin like protein
MDIDAKLGLDVFKIDKESHIDLDPELCKGCAARACVKVCPAKVYTEGDDGQIQVRFEGCLECGTCLIACPVKGGLKWRYPRGGFGIHFRFG